MMDRAGFDSLWMYETYFAAESFSRAGFIAALTEHCKIATGVVNPYTRHPGLIALGAATLDRLSGGRLILVMSSGGKEWTEGILGYSRRKPGTDLEGSTGHTQVTCGRESHGASGWFLNQGRPTG